MRFSIIVFTLFGMALQPVSASGPVSIDYGHVTGIEVTTKESAMARNMLIASLVGWAVHCEDDSSKNDIDEPGGENRQTDAEKCSDARKMLTEGGETADVQDALVKSHGVPSTRAR